MFCEVSYKKKIVADLIYVFYKEPIQTFYIATSIQFFNLFIDNILLLLCLPCFPFGLQMHQLSQSSLINLTV